MRRLVMRVGAVTAVGAAVLLGSSGVAGAAVDLGSYSSFESCSTDARSNGELGFPGVFYCMWSPNDGLIHQYYSDNVS